MDLRDLKTTINGKIDVFEYNVPSTEGKISVRIKIEITFIFRLHRRPIHRNLHKQFNGTTVKPKNKDYFTFLTRNDGDSNLIR